MEICLWDLSLLKVQLTNAPSCCGLKFISTFMPKLFASPSQWLRMDEKLQVFLRDTELLWWATLTLEHLKTFLNHLYNCTTVSDASTQLSLFSFFLQSIIPVVLCFLIALSVSYDPSPYLLSVLVLCKKKKKIFMFNLVLVSSTYITWLTQGKHNILYALG